MTMQRSLLTAGALGGLAASGAGWLGMRRGKRAYEAAVAELWQHGRGVPTTPAMVMRELVRYAVLAPSSHNTQCWRFVLDGQRVLITPDKGRRCPIVDPDDHHLYVSLGCATENLVLAAGAFGLHAEARYDAARDAVEVMLSPGPTVRSARFDAIPRRQTTRAVYDGQPLHGTELRALEESASGRGVGAVLLTSKVDKERILELVVEANTRQLRDPAFVNELKQWVRFDDRQALESGDGLFGRCSGNPTLPPWLGRRIFDVIVRPRSENDKFTRHLRSSAGVAVFSSRRDDRAHQVEVGRAFQCFALQATALGVRIAHLNQPVEVAALRPEVGALPNVGANGEGRVDLVIRFGRGPELPSSLRRPLSAVIA